MAANIRTVRCSFQVQNMDYIIGQSGENTRPVSNEPVGWTCKDRSIPYVLLLTTLTGDMSHCWTPI